MVRLEALVRWQDLPGGENQTAILAKISATTSLERLTPRSGME